jgi:F-type H+-transporting ATPase subunit g
VFHPAVRRRPFGTPRLASSSTNTTVEATQKKAQDALTSAQKNAGNFWEMAKKFVTPAGEKAGHLLGCAYCFFMSFILRLAYTILLHIFLFHFFDRPLR